MTDFSCKTWFENTFWPTYPRDLCNRIGSKSKAFTSAVAHVKSNEMADIVIRGLREQMLYYRKLKKKGEHDSAWKMGMCVTWLNGEHWADEIPSHYELERKFESKKCLCGEDAQIVDKCLACYEKSAINDDWRTKMCRQFYVKNGLGRKVEETQEGWILRLRETSLQLGRRIGK